MNAEEVEAGNQDGAGAGAKQEAAGADGRFIYHNFIGIVKGAVRSGEFVEVVAEEVRAQVIQGEVEGTGEAHEFAGEGALGISFEGACVFDWCLRVEFGFAENAVDARDGIEEVGGGVALEAEHAIPIEDIILSAVGGEVCVFKGTDSDRFGNDVSFGFSEFGVFLGDHGEGAFACLIEKGLEFDGFPGLGLKGFFIFS